MNELKIKFDCLASHDIGCICIVQITKASGLIEFLITYVLTNCHNSLCSGGEQSTKMIMLLGSDSHTSYDALGTMIIGEVVENLSNGSYKRHKTAVNHLLNS